MIEKDIAETMLKMEEIFPGYYVERFFDIFERKANLSEYESKEIEEAGIYNMKATLKADSNSIITMGTDVHTKKETHLLEKNLLVENITCRYLSISYGMPGKGINHVTLKLEDRLNTETPILDKENRYGNIGNKALMNNIYKEVEKILPIETKFYNALKN